MKYLKIQNEKGYYWDGSNDQEIDKINKQDLLTLLEQAEKIDFEIDKYNESLIKNKAHQIIYENLYNKFQQFIDNKEQFINDANKLYKVAIIKHSVKDIDITIDVEGDFKEEINEDEIKVENIPF